MADSRHDLPLIEEGANELQSGTMGPCSLRRSRGISSSLFKAIGGEDRDFLSLRCASMSPRRSLWAQLGLIMRVPLPKLSRGE